MSGLIEGVQQIGRAPNIEDPHHANAGPARQREQRKHRECRSNEVAVRRGMREAGGQIDGHDARHEEGQSHEAEAVQDEQRSQRFGARPEAQFRPDVSSGHDRPRNEAEHDACEEGELLLHALVGNKQEMLIACITERAKRLRAPADMPVPRDRQTLAAALASFGTQLLREVSEPTVIAIFRLAIAEAIHAPEVAQALDSIGRETSRAALRQIMARAQTSRLLDGRPAQLAEQFGGLLWCDLMVSLLLGVAERPSPREFGGRARNAAAAFLELHPVPDDHATPGRN